MAVLITFLSSFLNALYYIVIFGVISTIIIKIYNAFTTGVCTCKNRLDGKVILVTGANAGLGKLVCIDFAKRGAKIIMGCRNMSLAKAARDEIISLSKNENVVCYHLDLSSLASVRQFAKDIIKNEKRLDILMNNAGAGNLPRKKTEDGLDLGLQTNYYGHFLLTLLLIDLLKKSPAARIIHMSSFLHAYGRLDLNDLTSKSFFFNLPVYCDSKLYILLFNIELARRLKGTSITSNALHPGIITTGIWRNVSFGFYQLLQLALRMYFKNLEEGIQTIIHCTVSDKIENVTGKYFVDCKESTPSKKAQDLDKARKFWDISCKLVKLKPEEVTI